jgi:hypothetical protein
MKTKKTLKKKHSDFYEDSIAKPGLKGAVKKDKTPKKRLSIYDDFDEEEDFDAKSHH